MLLYLFICVILLASYLGMSHDFLDAPMYVFMLVGDSVMMNRVYRSCVVTINGYDTIVDIPVYCDLKQHYWQ